MAKIWCDECNGVGQVFVSEYVCNEYPIDVATDCPICKGDGFVKADVVEVENVKDKVVELMQHGRTGLGVAFSLRAWLDSLKEGKV